jgi:hypothetical protein
MWVALGLHYDHPATPIEAKDRREETEGKTHASLATDDGGVGAQ